MFYVSILFSKFVVIWSNELNSPTINENILELETDGCWSLPFFKNIWEVKYSLVYHWGVSGQKVKYDN